MRKEIKVDMAWESLVPVFMMVIEHGSDKSRDDVKEELLRMARAADKYRIFVGGLKDAEFKPTVLG